MNVERRAFPHPPARPAPPVGGAGLWPMPLVAYLTHAETCAE